MNSFLVLTFIIDFCFYQPAVHERENSKNYSDNPSAYFSEHIIPADTEIVNHNDSASTTYSINNHHIKWSSSRLSTSVTIDNYMFEVSNLRTLNAMWDNQTDSLGSGYVLYQIKTYAYQDNEIIGFEFGVAECAGLSCRVEYQLFYNVRAKTVTLFGQFNSGFHIDLYSFDKFPGLTFLSTDYSGSPWGIDTCYFVYHIFTLNPQGTFIPGKDAHDNEYFIKTRCSNFNGECKTESDNWFEPIESK